MKRKLKLCLVLTLCLSMLAGCGKSDATEPKDEIVKSQESEKSTIGDGLATPIPDSHESKSNVSESTDSSDSVDIANTPKETPASDSDSVTLAKELIDKQVKDVDCGDIDMRLVSDIKLTHTYEGKEVEELLDIELDLNVAFDKDTHAIGGSLNSNIINDNQAIVLKQYTQLDETYYTTYEYDVESDEWSGYKDSVEHYGLDMSTILNILSSNLFKDLTLDSNYSEYIVKGTIDYKALNESTAIELSDFALEDVDEDILSLVANMTFDKNTEKIKRISFDLDYNTVVINEVAQMYGLEKLAIGEFAFSIIFNSLGGDYNVEIPSEIIESAYVFDWTQPWNDEAIGEETHTTYTDADSADTVINESYTTFELDGIPFEVGSFTLSEFLTDGWEIDDFWSETAAGTSIKPGETSIVSLKNEELDIIWFEMEVKNISSSDESVENCEVIKVTFKESDTLRGLVLPYGIKFFDSYDSIKQILGEAENISYDTYMITNDYEGETYAYSWTFDNIGLVCYLTNNIGVCKLELSIK